MNRNEKKLIRECLEFCLERVTESCDEIKIISKIPFELHDETQEATIKRLLKTLVTE